MKVIVYIEGGNFQGAVCDTEDFELLFVDYDNEEETRLAERTFE